MEPGPLTIFPACNGVIASCFIIGLPPLLVIGLFLTVGTSSSLADASTVFVTAASDDVDAVGSEDAS